jgi:hypothetical protein
MSLADQRRIRAMRLIEGGHEIVEAPLPLLLTVVDSANIPRPPALKRVMKYKKARSLAEIQAEVKNAMPDASDETRAARVEEIASDLEQRGLLITQWNLDDIDAEASALTLRALAAGAIVFVATLVSIHDVPGWVKWNFEGYEAKADYPEYRDLMEAIDVLPPGRVMWEANSDMNKYGTPMALMLFPYWSDGHPSMEGLFIESSLTTPFHFVNASEVSESPSNPVRGITYSPGIDMDAAIRHLALYDVAYFVSYTDAGRDAARAAGLATVGNAPPWTIFALPDTDFVDIATVEPVVWDGDGEFTDAALEWYGDIDGLDRWLVEDGPDDWTRVQVATGQVNAGRPYTTGGVVSDVVVEDHRISFTTTAVGIPHFVKMSYFPNWTAEGADGPYRAAPSVMVVVPTSEHVVLDFSNTSAENLGTALTVITLAGLGTYWYRRRKRTTELVSA